MTDEQTDRDRQRQIDRDRKTGTGTDRDRQTEIDSDIKKYRSKFYAKSLSFPKCILKRL